MLYRLEPLTYLLQSGLEQLGGRSWSEIGLDTELFHYAPNWARYQRMEDDSCLRFMAARNEFDELVGYASIIIVENLHDYRILSAYIQDIYLDPDHRKGLAPFKGFLDAICEQLKALHVDHVTIGERENDPRGGVGVVYQRCGFESSERLWRKTLREVKV
jgi:hypothetical protein